MRVEYRTFFSQLLNFGDYLLLLMFGSLGGLQGNHSESVPLFRRAVEILETHKVTAATVATRNDNAGVGGDRGANAASSSGVGASAVLPGVFRDPVGVTAAAPATAEAHGGGGGGGGGGGHSGGGFAVFPALRGLANALFQLGDYGAAGIYFARAEAAAAEAYVFKAARS